MTVKRFHDLIVWQKSIQLVNVIYQLVKQLPKDELYSLSDQMRRSAISIPSNIAEGFERHSSKEYVQFLSIAKGSKAELQTQLIACTEIGYLTTAEIVEALRLSEEVSKMLSGLIKALTTDH